MDENVEITITLKLTQLNIILDLVGDGPFKIAAPLIQEIQKQASLQLQPAPQADGGEA